MSCPICAGLPLSADVSLAEAKATRMRVQGRVYSAPELDCNLDQAYGTTPMVDYFTVTLRLRKGQHIRLKFATRDELYRWQFILIVDSNVECEGCFHTIDKRGVLIDITDVVSLDNT